MSLIKAGTIDNMDRAHGGVSLFIKSNLPQSPVDVTSPLQTIVVNVTLHTTRVMETFMTRSNIYLFNDETPTYLHPATGSFISIDLTMCSPSLFMDFTWRVEDDLHGSDHHFKYLCSEAFLQDSLDGGLKLKIAL